MLNNLPSNVSHPLFGPKILPISLPRHMTRRLRTYSCHENGSLTLLFMPISRHSKNILASEGRVASITVADEHPAASRARVSLMGNVTVFYNVDDTPDKEMIEFCYVQKHPDARHWLPRGNSHAVGCLPLVFPCILSGLSVADGSVSDVLQAYWARFDPHVSARLFFKHYLQSR